MTRNVSYIEHQDLCCSCGACSTFCKVGAISYTYKRGLFVPQVDESLCVGCKLCVSVCPSAKVEVQSIYGNPELLSDEEKDCYIGYSLDEGLRRNGTSGGVVTTIIRELLRQRLYDKAYVLDFESFGGEPAKVKPVYQPDDLIRSAKSKYIPASIAEVVSDVVSGKIGKAIVVATPCQLLAIKRSLRIKKRDESDILFIGLFCDKTLNYNIYSYYRETYGEYDSFHFRDKEGHDWPGDTVLIKDGKPSVISRHVRMSLKSYFQLNRCRYCFDKLNQLADISCGDCYIKGEESKEGKSSIVVRTEKGRIALGNCADVLSLKESTFKEVKESQGLHEKKPNYVRNYLSSGAFVLPDKDRAVSGLEALKEEGLKELQMGARAISKKDFKRIDHRIAMSQKQHKTSKLKKVLKKMGRVFKNSDNTLKVLIDNADFENKGGELMLQSIVQQLESRMPKARIVVLDSVYHQNLNYFFRHGILPLHMDSGRKKQFKHFIYERVLNKPWYITPDQIDVVLDAGGFQFSDQWETTQGEISQRVRYYSSFTKKDRKIIFLPQAFGPFEKPLSKKLMKEIYSISDLLYAREPVSFNYLKELFPNDNKIKLCPDFTCLSLSGKKQKVFLPEDYAVVIPNVRMMTHTADGLSSQYFEFIGEIIRFLMKKGEFVVLLNHEGPDDERLLKEINKSLPKKVLMLSELDALEIKGVIAGARLVVSSRYHGIVSGLTQHVPTLCTSWSHKYLELLKEHGCEGNVLPVDDIERSKQIIAEALVKPEVYSTKEGCLDGLQEKAREMWNEIFSMIEK